MTVYQNNIRSVTLNMLSLAPDLDALPDTGGQRVRYRMHSHTKPNGAGRTRLIPVS